MTQMQYTIPTFIRFSYKQDEGKHQLFSDFEWISPVSGKVIESSVLEIQYYQGEERLFYDNTEVIMKNEAGIKQTAANEMARVLRSELQESGGIDWDKIAKEKFEERLKITYDVNVFVDLDLPHQN